MNSPASGPSRIQTLNTWLGPIPSPLYHGSPFAFDAFDLARSNGVAWFTPDFNAAAQMARNFVKDMGRGVAGVYVCQLTCARIAQFSNEDDIFALARTLTNSYERKDRLTAVSNALAAFGFDGMVDLYTNFGKYVPPSIGALRTDVISLIEYVTV